MTRHNFDTWIPTGSQLRDLACDIALLDATRGYSFLTNPADKVHNFLANAEIGGAWHQPMDYLPQTIAHWKCSYRSTLPLTPVEEQGFNEGSSTRRGLALLFDPLVDSFLAAHRMAGQIAPGGTVIVLSDFYPLAKAIPNGICAGDWGCTESEHYLLGLATDKTTTRLFNGLFGEKEWVKQTDRIQSMVTSRNLLLWNFLPVFRGGNSATGWDGLPATGNWRQRCWDFMCQFVSAVGASTLVLACGEPMLPKPFPHKPVLSMPLPPSPSAHLLAKPATKAQFSSSPLIESLTPLPSCVKKLHRIEHPYRWPICGVDAVWLRTNGII